MMMSMNNNNNNTGMNAVGVGPVGPVARWLDTIVSSNMCKQYVEVFKRYGYDTLTDVCKLESHQLAQMGVTNSDNEKIMENVSVLRQTLKVNGAYKSYGASNVDGGLVNKIEVLTPAVINGVSPAPVQQPGAKPSRKVSLKFNGNFFLKLLFINI